jgi:hypothetical protein
LGSEDVEYVDETKFLWKGVNIANYTNLAVRSFRDKRYTQVGEAIGHIIQSTNLPLSNPSHLSPS